MNRSDIATRLCALSLACAAVPVLAADTAKGTLKMTSDGRTISAAINHVYYITGPDTFAPEKTTRRLIFSTLGTRVAIDAVTTQTAR